MIHQKKNVSFSLRCDQQIITDIRLVRKINHVHFLLASLVFLILIKKGVLSFVFLFYKVMD